MHIIWAEKQISPLHMHMNLQQKAAHFFGSPREPPVLRILPESTTNGSNKNQVTVAPLGKNVTFQMLWKTVFYWEFLGNSKHQD